MLSAFAPMKTKLFLPFLFVALLVAGVGRLAAASAAATHRVVFEVTSPDARVWTGALNNVENLRTALGGATEVEVVAHGNGLGFLLRTNTALADRMKRLAADGVVFAACRNTMRRQHVTADALLPFATTVDSGVAEVVRRQEQGWAYVHVGS